MNTQTLPAKEQNQTLVDRLFLYLQSTSENKLLGKLTLLIVAILAYFPAISLEFQYRWDDQWVVINRYTDNGLAISNIIHILADFYHGQYAPLNQLYYTIIYELFGYNPYWFHVCSLLIHLINCLLVYNFINRLLFMKKKLAVAAVNKISFFTALIFAVHSFAVEEVCWISASKIIIYALFYLLAMLQYLKYLEQKSFKRYLLITLLYLLSFAGKEQAVTLPLCLILIDIYIRGRTYAFGKKALLEKGPLLGLSLALGIVTMLSQAAVGYGVLSNETPYPYLQRLCFGCYALTEYFTKCLIPVKLLYLYTFPNTPEQEMPVRFLFYPPIVLLLAVSLKKLWKIDWVAFGIGLFIIHLLVCLHIISMARGAIVADRYAYISSIGIFFVIAYGCYQAKSFVAKKTLTVLCIAFISYLAIYTNFRVRDWHNSESIKKQIMQLIKPDIKS